MCALKKERATLSASGVRDEDEVNGVSWPKCHTNHCAPTAHARAPDLLSVQTVSSQKNLILAKLPRSKQENADVDEDGTHIWKPFWKGLAPNVTCRRGTENYKERAEKICLTCFTDVNREIDPTMHAAAQCRGSELLYYL